MRDKLALRGAPTLRAKLTARVKLTPRGTPTLRAKLAVRVKLALRCMLTLRAKSALRAKLALRGSPAAPGTPARRASEPRTSLKLLHHEASLHCKIQRKLGMSSLRVAPQGLVDLTPRGLRGEVILGSGWPCKLEA